MAEQTLKEKTAKGLFWGGLSNGVQQVLNALFGLVLARVLNASDYGMVGMLAIFSAIASTIQESGFTAALTNQKEIKHKDYNAVFWFSSLTGVLFYLVLFFCAPLIARFYDKPELIGLSRIAFLGFLFGGFGIASNAYLFKTLMIKERAKIDIVSLICSGLIGVTLALNGFTYYGIAIQNITYIGIGSLLKFIYAPWKPTFQMDLHPLKLMFGFSSKLILTNVFTQVSNNIFSVVLGKFYSPQQLGFYSQGQKWMTMGQLAISGMLSNVVQPITVKVKNDILYRVIVFRKLIRFTSLIVLPFMLGLAFVSEEFIYITIGEKWLLVVPILQKLCIVGVTYNFSIICIQTLISYEGSMLVFKTSVFLNILQLIFVVCAGYFGFDIMVSMYVLSNVIGMCVWMKIIASYLNFPCFDFVKDIVPYLFITLFVFFCVYCILHLLDYNVYVFFFIKIVLSICWYAFLMYTTNSKIFKDCLLFLWRKK